MTSIPELFAQPRAALLEAAAARGMELPPHLEHGELVGALVAHLADAGEAVVADGELSMMHEGFGFVRLAAADYAETASDAYVSQKQIRALNLQHGHRVRGRVRAPRGAERSLSLQHVDTVQGVAVEKIGDVAPFSSRRAVVATRPLLLGEPLMDAIGDVGWTRGLAWIFNLLSIIAIAVGLAGSLAMGVFQIQTGIAELIGIENSGALTAAVFVAVCIAFMIPLRRDLGEGMSRLSIPIFSFSTPASLRTSTTLSTILPAIVGTAPSAHCQVIAGRTRSCIQGRSMRAQCISEPAVSNKMGSPPLVKTT